MFRVFRILRIRGKDIIKIILATEDDKVLWDSYVINHKDATPYHTYAWKQAIETAYGHNGYYLVAVTGGGKEHTRKVTGILPLIHLKVPFGRGALISLPFCDIAGPLFDDKDTEEQLYVEALKLGKRIGVNEIEIRAPKPDFEHDGGSYQVDTQSHKVRMFLDLPKSSKILWENFNSKYRNKIKKPEKEGFHFEWGGINKIDDFYKVFSTNMRDLGSPVHSKEWFRVILNFYGDKAHMGLVYKGSEPVNCGIILLIKNKIINPWASGLKKYNHLKPNMMLYWNFLSFAADNGYSRFDFGRSTPGEGTYKFKSQWGAKPNPLNWHHIYLNNIKSFNRAAIQEGRSTKREIAVNTWRKLPMCVANTLGPRIRKYISL